MYMEDAEMAVSEAFTVSWKNINASRLDAARLKEEHPDLYKQYEKQLSSRRFSIKAA